MPLYSRRKHPSLWLTFLLCCFINISAVYASEVGSGSKIVGAVDVLGEAHNIVTLQGWAGALELSNQDSIDDIEVRLGDKLVLKTSYRSIDHFPRLDVNKVMGRSDWMEPGWRLKFPIPDELSTGSYPLKVSLVTSHGEEFSLDVNNAAKVFPYIKPGITERIKAFFVPSVAITFIAFLAIIFFFSNRLAATLSIKTNLAVHPAMVFTLGLTLVFTSIIILGITGSSVGVGVEQTPFINSDVKTLWGDEQPIRSDEWLIQTPNAIAQTNHLPRFPIINSNLGKDGQNMLIPGMTGEPVAHISQLVKPATWGFYVFDLKRALSWNWCFPIFACLLALWAVICDLNPGSWRQNFIASLCFSSAAYVVAWSNWPAYTVFFPCVIYLLSISILKSKKNSAVLTQAVLLGLAFAGFVLVLYPPWQISVTYIFITITIGKLIHERLYKNFSLVKICAYFLAFALAGFILYWWWHDAHSAIEAMENTIYPGRRTTILGGNINLGFLLRGYTNLDTLLSLSSPVSNPSEVASFYYLLLPLLTLFILRVYQGSISALEISLACGIAFTLYFMFFGIPAFLAEYSLWGRVPEKRADLALGLACLIMASMLGSQRHSSPQRQFRYPNSIALASAIAWTALSYLTVHKMHESILSAFQAGSQVIVFSVILLSGFLLARGWVRSHFVILFLLSGFTTYSFNPIVSAPSYVQAKTPDLNGHSLTTDRVLALESSTPAMYLLASGTKVLNGIFYYPQKTIWSQLDPAAHNADIYNRYQHLRFYAKEEVGANAPYILENPGLDRVEIGISAERFDFAAISADLVVAPAGTIALKENKSLNYIATENGWTWFSVVR